MRSSSLRFWTFLHWGTFGVSLAFVSVLLFVLGVSAILEMVRYLFGVGISSRAYQHIYVTATTLVGPLFALGRIPQDFSDEAVIAGHSKDRLSSGLGILHNWIAAPLALVMALVLHVYAAKIVATGELPKNQIGWIVSGFALFVLSARVAADPFMRYGGAATRLFGRVWALALVVPIALLAYALFLRIAEHGATVERYYLAVAALAAGCIVAAQAPARTRGDLRVMTAIPVALLALSAFGPWGVSATVARSQIAWLTSEVATVDGQLRFGDLTNEARDTARSRVRALADAGALDRILPRLAEADRNAVAGLHDEPLETVILDRLGLAYGTPSPNHFAFSASETGPFDVVGYDTVFAYLSSNPGDLNAASPGEQVVRIVIEGPDVAVRYLGTTDRFESARLLRAPPDPADTRPFTLDLTTKGGRSLRLFVRSVFFNPASESEASATFDLALRRGEWENPASLGGDGNR